MLSPSASIARRYHPEPAWLLPSTIQTPSALAIRDAVDEPVTVIADVERTIRRDRKADGPAGHAVPWRGSEPAGDEIGIAGGLSAAEGDEYDFVAGRRTAIPGAMARAKCATLVLRRKHRAVVEHDAQRRGVRLERQRRLHLTCAIRSRHGRVGVRLTIAIRIRIALGPPVVAAGRDDIEFVGRQVGVVGR